MKCISLTGFTILFQIFDFFFFFFVGGFPYFMCVMVMGGFEMILSGPNFVHHRWEKFCLVCEKISGWGNLLTNDNTRQY